MIWAKFLDLHGPIFELFEKSVSVENSAKVPCLHGWKQRICRQGYGTFLIESDALESVGRLSIEKSRNGLYSIHQAQHTVPSNGLLETMEFI